MSEAVRYSIVVPVYNEEGVVGECHRRLKETMDSCGESYELIFVNDGSSDATGTMVRGLCAKDPKVKLIDFSRNFGHQVAISAGMDHASGDAVVVIDADLQDPPDVILHMIEKWKEGFQVVYGKRSERKGETAFKKATAFLFYRFLASMTDVTIPTDVGDFRLIDRRVCDVMAHDIHERNRFIRGIVSWVGFRQTSVDYVRHQRFAGKTKYPFMKMVHFAADAIVSFSHKPLRMAMYLGVFTSLSGFAYLFYALVMKYLAESTIRGWTSLVVLMLIFNGMILFMLGIIGEYIGRIYDESKNRPLYIINESIGLVRPNRTPSAVEAVR